MDSPLARYVIAVRVFSIIFDIGLVAAIVLAYTAWVAYSRETRAKAPAAAAAAATPPPAPPAA